MAGKACDEVFASWRQTRGWFRSPLNTLVYKQAHSGEDVQCLYRFVTDRRLFARVILTVTGISFKDNPFNQGGCGNCLEDRVDKLLIWEPLPPGSNSSQPPVPLTKAAQSGGVTCLCNKHAFKTTQIISKGIEGWTSSSSSFTSIWPLTFIFLTGEQLNLQLFVDSAHSALSYFKHNAPLFEANYEFVHGPLCGPPIIQPMTDGEIHYPYYEAIGYVNCLNKKKIPKIVTATKTPKSFAGTWSPPSPSAAYGRSKSTGSVTSGCISTRSSSRRNRAMTA